MPQKALPLETRFWAKVQKTDGCWDWIAGKAPNGYGTFCVKAKTGDTAQTRDMAHRVAYQLFNGPIAAGLQIDHLCRNRACVNPSHLEAVTSRTNVLRGVGITALNARKIHCVHGHEFSPENTRTTYGWRFCIACQRDRNLQRKRA